MSVYSAAIDFGKTKQPRQVEPLPGFNSFSDSMREPTVEMVLLSPSEIEDYVLPLLAAFEVPCKICTIARDSKIKLVNHTHNAINCKHLKKCFYTVSSELTSQGFPTLQQAGLPPFDSIIQIRKFNSPRSVKARITRNTICLQTQPFWHLPAETQKQLHLDACIIRAITMHRIQMENNHPIYSSNTTKKRKPETPPENPLSQQQAAHSKKKKPNKNQTI
jgi:hypothetical protein